MPAVVRTASYPRMPARDSTIAVAGACEHLQRHPPVILSTFLPPSTGPSRCPSVEPRMMNLSDDPLVRIYRALAHFFPFATEELVQCFNQSAPAERSWSGNKKKISLVRRADILGGGDGHCDMSAVAEIVLY